jgi:endonuclease/exonuclease/phosphatase family metal-dependent hydrolase
MANVNIQTKIDNYKTEFKFLTYNIDQSVREEQFDQTKWMNRKDRVRNLIKEVDADIVCLQEMRQLSGAISTNKFLAEFDDYFYEVAYRNPSPLAFGQAILYKPNKFFPVKIVKKWLSDTPDIVSDTFLDTNGKTSFGYLLLGVQFVPVVNNKVVIDPLHNAAKDPFWVFNTHFGLDEAVKTKSCHILKRVIEEIVQGQKFILSGDFNFFFDKEGNNQRIILTEKYQDLAKGAKTLAGKTVEGTFIGYDHDEFKSDLNNMQSRLDHIFGSGGVIGTNATLYTKTMLISEPTELTTRNYPSDHLPIVINITM